MTHPIRRWLCPGAARAGAPAAAWAAMVAAMFAATLAGSSAAWAQAGHAHVHGEVALEISIDARSVGLRLAAPQDSLLGHERTPRTAAELQAAAALVQRLQGGAALFGLPAGLGCTLASAEIEAPRLQPAAKPGAVANRSANRPADSHADIEASYRFNCSRTDGLRSLDLGALMDAFPRIQRISTQVAGPAGQHQAQLRRPARVLAWGR